MIFSFQRLVIVIILFNKNVFQESLVLDQVHMILTGLQIQLILYSSGSRSQEIQNLQLADTDKTKFIFKIHF